jgi:hypothetical protein
MIVSFLRIFFSLKFFYLINLAYIPNTSQAFVKVNSNKQRKRFFYYCIWIIYKIENLHHQRHFY